MGPYRWRYTRRDSSSFGSDGTGAIPSFRLYPRDTFGQCTCREDEARQVYVRTHHARGSRRVGAVPSPSQITSPEEERTVGPKPTNNKTLSLGNPESRVRLSSGTTRRGRHQNTRAPRRRPPKRHQHPTSGRDCGGHDLHGKDRVLDSSNMTTIPYSILLTLLVVQSPSVLAPGR